MIDIKTIATGSKGNCYYVTDGHTPLLLEGGVSFKQVQKALNFQTADIKGCLITHEHNDHVGGLKSFLKAGIDCYMSPGTAKAIDLQHHRIHEQKAKHLFKIGTWTILGFDVQHDVSEPFGFILMNEKKEKLLFATDTYYIKYQFKGITHLMLECNYCQSVLDANNKSGRLPKGLRQRIMKSHFSLENVLDFLRANDLSVLKEIWLLHLSDSNSDEQLIRDEVAKVTGKLIHIP
ncbi:MBL fold metallo-hydrolase [Paenisporosarcina cavernae]|uniref:MBL fold metallo-hydrolase n=1 Tax=Paenisporosarcina cavernae TaxID=2320858 RepID=A0A385YTM4_9BACL|nr:MBL fold metallo-hydrolase [Paenisporosarcina cavernae]AYC30026.1 MBL fold metallo-hydrolase [Paenisporosarcina cavernae]